MIRALLANPNARAWGRTGVAKLDCQESPDAARFAAAGIPALGLAAGRFCPDHALMEALPGVRAWAAGEGLEALVIETAGLCGRCAPYLDDAAAVAVVDATSGIAGPGKLGPLLADADVIVATRGDLVSQAEREVFAVNVRLRNARAPFLWVDGLTGEGAIELSRRLADPSVPARGGEGRARTPLPQLYCSYCMGRREVGIAAL